MTAREWALTETPSSLDRPLLLTALLSLRPDGAAFADEIDRMSELSDADLRAELANRQFEAGVDAGFQEVADRIAHGD